MGEWNQIIEQCRINASSGLNINGHSYRITKYAKDKAIETHLESNKQLHVKRFDVKRIDEKDKLIQSLKVKLKKEKLEKGKAALEAKKNYKKLQEMKKNIKDQKFNVSVKWKWKNDSNEWKECSDGL